VANSCLEVLKGVSSPPLIGGKRVDSTSGANQLTNSRMAIIGRTNARIFQVRFSLIAYGIYVGYKLRFYYDILLRYY
jgi:hypothetical protein